MAPSPPTDLAKCLFLFCFLLASSLPAAAQTHETPQCDATMWQHVYHPKRLKIVSSCVAATGILVDATHGRNRDGARHEADGDTHAWLKLDPGQDNLLLPGNTATQQGNLVFELVCYYRVTQEDAKSSCVNFHSPVRLPRLGQHIRITGVLIEDLQHQPIHRELHPVTKIEVLP